jgi:hypothetical protein
MRVTSNVGCFLVGSLLVASMTVVRASSLAEPPDVKPEKRTGHEAKARNVLDFLWLLDAPDKSKLTDDQRDVLQQLNKSKVPTVAKADKAATWYKLKADGLLAEEGSKVTGLVPLGVDVPDFAKRGELIWIVQFRMFRHGALTQEVWVSSSTGATRAMLPPKR